MTDIPSPRHVESAVEEDTEPVRRERWMPSALRRRGDGAELEDVEIACLERNGEISVVLKKPA